MCINSKKNLHLICVGKNYTVVAPFNIGQTHRTSDLNNSLCPDDISVHTSPRHKKYLRKISGLPEC